VGGLTQAILLDALGTLVELEPPAPALRRALRERGVDVDAAAADRAMTAEIACYRDHLGEGADATGVAALRRRCAQALADALPAGVAAALSIGVIEAALLASLRFVAFPDAAPALESLRGRGRRLVVVSNWDRSLHGVLAATGLAPLLHGAVTSAEAGVAKPDPAIFARALALAGVPASRAVHVGDRLDEDVGGARAAGIEPVLIVRDGHPQPAAGVPAVIRSLAELADGCP
jgi:putative hydrolase of the HAD superfamily